MTDLPSLRETLDAHGLSAKKSFGQHFLLDLNVTRKIVRLVGPFDGRAVIEVGPGPGGLTRAILESDAGKVVLVEKDPRFIPLLSELDDGSGRLTIVEAEKVVEPGELDPADVHVAGVFVDRVVALTPEQAQFKMIEKRTTTPRPGTDEEA